VLKRNRKAVTGVKKNMGKAGRPVISKPFITGLLLYRHKKAASERLFLF